MEAIRIGEEGKLAETFEIRWRQAALGSFARQQIRYALMHRAV